MIYLNYHYQTHEVFITNKSGESTIYIKSRYVKQNEIKNNRDPKLLQS